MAHRRRVCGTAQAVRHAARDHLQNQARVGPGDDHRGGQEPGAAVSLGGGGRGVWEQSGLSGWRGGAGSVVFCRSAPQYASLGRTPGDTPPAVAWAWSSPAAGAPGDRKSTRLNSSHGYISYAVFCLKKKKKTDRKTML